ncbi:MAG: MBOAT family O-acyltransferase [Bacillota bacterium]
MLFNSVPYIFFFLPGVVIVYFALNRQHRVEAAKWWLAAASIVFYAWWNLANLPLLLLSVTTNWLAVNAIWRARERGSGREGRFLVAGLLFNLLFLGLFKYYDFVAASVNAALATNLPLLGVALPLGISFFTLTQIAYLVDAREGLVPRQRFQNFALFVLFFPHLIIGPILHHKDMMPQFETLKTKVFSLDNLAAGLLRFGIGFAKKALIADPLGIYVRLAFDDAPHLGGGEAWQAAIAFAFQLYFDFSGYVDMALGSALMLNIRMPENFDSPLRARSIIEFWSRWHMTLTRFLTTYIYTPLLYAMKPLSFAKSMAAVFVTFFIAGIWHGAAWTFIVFGAAHGAALTINHVWRRQRWPMPGPIGWALTFGFVMCTFVLFRAKSLHDALKVFAGMLGLDGWKALNGWPSRLPVAVPDALVAYGIDPLVVVLVILSAVLVFACANSTNLTARFQDYLKGPSRGHRPDSGALDADLSRNFR